VSSRCSHACASRKDNATARTAALHGLCQAGPLLRGRPRPANETCIFPTALSNFAFLLAEWPLLHEAGHQAEDMANTDARASCFYARRTLELAVDWLYKHDRGVLRLPYQDQPQRADSRTQLPAGGGRCAVHQGQGSSRTSAIWPCTAPARWRRPMRWRPRASCSTSATGWRAPMASGRGLTPACSFQPRCCPRQQPLPCPAEPGPVAEAGSATAERDEKLSDAAVAPGRAGRRTAGAARGGGRRQEGQHRPARHPRLFRSRDARLLHRPAAEGSRLGAGPEEELRDRSHGHAQQPGQGLRGLRAVGRRRQAAGAGGGQAHQEGCQGGAAAGQALRRLPGKPSTASGR
jgi:hypothetical protein